MPDNRTIANALNRTPWFGLTQQQWRDLITTAYRNLPDNTPVSSWDIDAVLTWCIPLYNEYKAANEQ